MSKCELVLAEIRVESKADKLFWLFKPKELVYWEPFDLHLSFRNNTDQAFGGGKCTFGIKAEFSRLNFEIDLPLIEPNKVEEVIISNIRLSEIGVNALTDILVQNTEGKKVLCKDPDGGETSKNRQYSIHAVSREELYQKYAVVVALFFSVLASILTIVNVLVAIFK